MYLERDENQLMGIVELQLHDNLIYFLSMDVLDLDIQIDVPGIGGVLFI